MIATRASEFEVSLFSHHHVFPGGEGETLCLDN